MSDLGDIRSVRSSIDEHTRENRKLALPNVTYIFVHGNQTSLSLYGYLSLYGWLSRLAYYRLDHVSLSASQPSSHPAIQPIILQP